MRRSSPLGLLFAIPASTSSSLSLPMAANSSVLGSSPASGPLSVLGRSRANALDLVDQGPPASGCAGGLPLRTFSSSITA